jgi:hypothetical protein
MTDTKQQPLLDPKEAEMAAAMDESLKPTPEAVEVMPRTIEDPDTIPFQLMDQVDEDQILADIKGQMMSEQADKWVYEFPSGGKVVRGLSWTGTKELRFWLAKSGVCKITELPEYNSSKEVTVGDNQYIDVTCAMQDMVTGIKATATVRQGYFKVRRDGTKVAVDVEFVPRIAESKAQRNAMQKLIPASQLAEFISNAKSQGRIQMIEPSKEGTVLSAEEYKVAAPFYSQIEQLKTIEECREYWRQIDKQTSKLNGKIGYNIKATLQRKADVLKAQKAKAKIKVMVAENK